MTVLWIPESDGQKRLVSDVARKKFSKLNFSMNFIEKTIYTGYILYEILILSICAISGLLIKYSRFKFYVSTDETISGATMVYRYLNLNYFPSLLKSIAINFS